VARIIFTRIGVGDVYTMLGVEGDGYSPDLAHDIVARARELFAGALQDAIESGYWTQFESLEEEDEDWEEVDQDGWV